MSNSPRTSIKGNILTSLLVLMGLTGLAAYFGGVIIQRQKAAETAWNNKKYPVTTASAVEAALLALRAAERTYYRSVRSFYGTDEKPGRCHGPARSFVRAIVEGVSCLGAGGVPVKTGLDVTLLTANDWDKDLERPPFVTYGAKCNFQSNGPADCSKNGKVILKVGEGDQWKQYFGGVHSFSIESVDLKAGILALKVDVKGGDKDTSYRVGLRWDAGNLAHLEPSGQVTQERPDPAGLCSTDQRPGRKGKTLGPWTPLYIFDSDTAKCRPFMQAGSGKGIAYYEEKYFGLRPADGQIVVYNEMLGAKKPFLVSEEGLLIDKLNPRKSTDGKIGFKYSKEALRNVDDFTILDGHIYYVAHQGQQAHIGYLAPGKCPENLKEKVQFDDWCRIPVCALGKQGFSMRYKGLAAPSWTQSLFRTEDGAPEDSKGPRRSTTFLLKTSSGSLLRAVAWNNPGEAVYSECAVVMDRQDQVVEYLRTYGFDRASSERPYYVF